MTSPRPRCLLRVVKWLAAAIAFVVLIPIVVFVGYYWAADAPGPIPETTALDPSLPAFVLSGYRFHLETRGDPLRPTVIVLHGGPGNDFHYLLPLAVLADDYHVVFYDQRGAGLSPRVSAEQYTVEKYLEDLHEIGEYFSPHAPVRIIGHSWGAMLASAYLGLHPERVSHVVLAEPGFLNPPMGDRFLAELTARTDIGLTSLGVLASVAARAMKLPHDERDEDAPFDFFFRELSLQNDPANPIADYFCGRTIDEQVLAGYRFGSRVNLTMMRSLTNETGRVEADFSAGLSGFPREVLLLTSSCNQIIGEDVQREHQKLFPRARLERIEGSGHMIFNEQPETAVRVVRRYFRQ